MGTKKGQRRKTARRAYENMTPSNRKKLYSYQSVDSRTLFLSPVLMRAAQKDKTGRKALKLAKIDELLGFRKRKK